uniref:Uncharacterized protein n=1 Tax=Anguilla anguilla TaxID=7936 RepID=A0A0E9SKA5_ANGAN
MSCFIDCNILLKVSSDQSIVLGGITAPWK